MLKNMEIMDYDLQITKKLTTGWYISGHSSIFTIKTVNKII